MFCGQLVNRGQLVARTWLIWCLNILRAVHSMMWCFTSCNLTYYIQDYYSESDRMIVGVQIELSAILSMKLG